MSASHLPAVYAYRLVALQSGKNGKTVLVVAIEFERIVFRRVVGISGDVGIVIVMEACNIPIVNLHVFDFEPGILPRDGVVSRREAVVNDVSALMVREYEVAGCLKEVFVFFSGRSCVVVVGIHIAAALILADVYQVHLHNAIDRTVVLLFYYLLAFRIIVLLTELYLHGIAGGDADHILGGTVVTLLECPKWVIGILLVLVGVIVIDVFLFYFLIRHVHEALVLLVGFSGKLAVSVMPRIIGLVIEVCV